MPTITESTLDSILALQVVVAWAGEALCEPARLGWWRTDLVDEAGGGDLFRRLLPKTHPWAGLETVRRAATQADLKARSMLGNPDHVRTLFFWGFTLDQKLNERLRHHKLSLCPPEEALPLAASLKRPFARDSFEATLRLPTGKSPFDVTPAGRQMSGKMPEDLAAAASHLAAALLPLGDKYPLPFFRVQETQ